MQQLYSEDYFRIDEALTLPIIVMLTSQTWFKHFTSWTLQLSHTRFPHNTAGAHLYKGFFHGGHAFGRHAFKFHFSHAATAETAEWSLLFRRSHLKGLRRKTFVHACVATGLQYYLFQVLQLELRSIANIEGKSNNITLTNKVMQFCMVNFTEMKMAYFAFSGKLQWSI